MICPHCSQNIKYKERSNFSCSKCGKIFAFEPKTDPLKLTDTRFRNAWYKISNNKTCFFTAGQLQYLLHRKLAKRRPGLLAVAIILTVIAPVFAILSFIALFNRADDNTLFYIWGGAIVLFIAAAVGGFFLWYNRVYQKIPLSVEIIQSLNSFKPDVLNRWERVYKTKLDKLITPEVLQQHQPPPPETLKGFLVCADKDVLQCLAANRIDEKLGLGLIQLAQPTAKGELKKIEYAKTRSNLPVFVLHEASVEGCNLKSEFLQTFWKTAEQKRVIDIGLRPAKTMTSNLIHQQQSPFDSFSPANLTAEEINFLKAGYYTPLLALTPERLIKYVTNAVAKPLQAAEKYSYEVKAKAVGFMTWAG
jgi:hypothetical protein